MSGVYISQQPTWGRAFMLSVLAAFSTRPMAALVVGAKVRLSKDPAFAASPDATVAGLAANEADFSGYTAGGYTLTLEGVLRLADLIEGQSADVLAVGSGSPFTGNSLYGYWIDDGVNVIMSESFGAAAPITVATAGGFVEIDLRMPIGLSQPAE